MFQPGDVLQLVPATFEHFLQRLQHDFCAAENNADESQPPQWQWLFTITDDCGEATTLGPGFPIVTTDIETPPCCLPGYFHISAEGVRDNFSCVEGTPNLCTGENMDADE